MTIAELRTEPDIQQKSSLLIRVPATEFRQRAARLQAAMVEKKLDALFVYGDEYRKENLRYVSNFWPIFERAACVIPARGEPILVVAPEGERYAREMAVWPDVRNIKEFACVSVPEEIDYPFARFSSLREIIGDALDGGNRLGIVGRWDISAPLIKRVTNAVAGLELVDEDDLLVQLRLIKSENEISCLREAGRQACVGYEKLMEACVPGNTEVFAAGAAEGAARMAGAEGIVFTVFGSGDRTNTIIGRATDKVIEDGDMIMAAFAVQYQGYVATVEFPFVAGSASDAQRRLISVLFEAANEQIKHLRDGCPAGEMVRAVKSVFRKLDVGSYDVYPPMHGAGLAEAESPYPSESSTYLLQAGMCVNSDISLFGHPAGSNRIEEGFVIRDFGPESTTPLIRRLCERGIA